MNIYKILRDFFEEKPFVFNIRSDSMKKTLGNYEFVKSPLISGWRRLGSLSYFQFCQAQSQLQGKLRLKTELALFFFNPFTHPPTHPPTPPTPPGKVYFPNFFIDSLPSNTRLIFYYVTAY
jgi:hypothetical protein